MARKIKGVLYRISLHGRHLFVECENKEDLFRYIAQITVYGCVVMSVTEMCYDGSTPKVKVFTDKEFKRILRSYQNAKADTK